MIWDTQFTKCYENINFGKAWVPFIGSNCQIISVEVYLGEEKLIELLRELRRCKSVKEL